MASNRIPDGYADLMALAADAYVGAQAIGAAVPLLINTAADIGADLGATQAAQLDYQTLRGGLGSLSAVLRAEREAAYAFCFTARDLLRVYCGRGWCPGWMAAGFENGLEVPRSYAGLRELLAALEHYFILNPAQANAAVGITAALATERLAALQSAHGAINSRWALVEARLQVRDAAVTALRRRLSDLRNELSMRLEEMDPRWLVFGFNLPGAATMPGIPENVVVTPLSGARLQISCEASSNAWRYRFFVQRPILDPEPVAVGGSTEPLFVTEPLVPGAEYLVYVSAVNEGAESNLSAPVTAMTRAAVAA